MTKFSISVEAESGAEAREQIQVFMGLSGMSGMSGLGAPIVLPAAELSDTERQAMHQMRAAEAAKESVQTLSNFAESNPGRNSSEPAEAPKRTRKAKAEQEAPAVETVLTGTATQAGAPAQPVDPMAEFAEPGDEEVDDDPGTITLDMVPQASGAFNEWVLDCMNRITETGKATRADAGKAIAGIIKDFGDGARGGDQLYQKNDPELVLNVVRQITKLVNSYVSG